MLRQLISSAGMKVAIFVPSNICTMIVTPDGSIIRICGKQPKPETDPNWIERKAKRQRRGE